MNMDIADAATAAEQARAVLEAEYARLRSLAVHQELLRVIRTHCRPGCLYFGRGIRCEAKASIFRYGLGLNDIALGRKMLYLGDDFENGDVSKLLKWPPGRGTAVAIIGLPQMKTGQKNLAEYLASCFPSTTRSVAPDSPLQQFVRVAVPSSIVGVVISETGSFEPNVH